jgi:RND family efflux transporter MFP subunit
VPFSLQRSLPALGLALALAAGCSRSAAPAPVVRLPVVPVRVTTVALTVAPQTQPVAGTIRPFAHATIAAKITGLIATANLAVGRSVSAGEILVTIQAGELDAQVSQAQAALDQAGREFEREKALESKGASTADAVHTADNHLREARATLQAAEAMLGYTRIAAPFAGVVTDDLVKPGDLATPGRPLFDLEGVDRLRAEVQVPESLPLPPVGAALAVQVDDALLAGKLAELSPAADPLSRTRLAKIDLPPAASARSGQFVRVLWPAGNRTAIMVPATAVQVFGQMERVFVVSAGQARLRLVKTTLHEGAWVQVSSGLGVGETIVVAPSAALRDGSPVEIQP